MAGGLGGLLGDFLGGSAPGGVVQEKGVFRKGQARKLSRNLGRFLLERFQTPVTELPEFLQRREGLLDTLTRVSSGARQRLSNQAVAGGFFDSGARLEALGGIDVGEQEAATRGISDIIQDIERRKVSELFPFLGAASRESLGLSQLLLDQRGQDIDLRGQNIDVVQDFLENIGGTIPF